MLISAYIDKYKEIILKIQKHVLKYDSELYYEVNEHEQVWNITICKKLSE